ncbi:tyrosine-type recombinase/integrase [Cryobacterium breve]
MAGFSANTQTAYAVDMARFFDFLWHNRDSNGPRLWRDATVEDRRAYFVWRNLDERGPRVEASTWNREVATLGGFYTWASQKRLIGKSPMSMRPSRKRPFGRTFPRQDWSIETPSEKRRDTGEPSVNWLTPSEYRRWRDVGIRGFGADGFRDRNFRGDLAGRNVVFADLMIRTGLRLSEEASLTIFDIPPRDVHRDYVAGKISKRTAKYESGRTVYYPSTVLRDLEAYVRGDRAESIERAYANGHNIPRSDSFLVHDPTIPIARTPDGRSVRIAKLNPAERRRVLVRRDGYWEPALVWLTQGGLPMSTRSWQSVFKDANSRCERHDVRIKCHPHALRHSYAVIELERRQQMQLLALSMSEPDRRTYARLIHGDPLDWVRIRLGHASKLTTLKYVHALADMDPETRRDVASADWGFPDAENESGESRKERDT